MDNTQTRKQRIAAKLQSELRHTRERLELAETKLDHAQEEVERHQNSVDFHTNAVQDLEYQLMLVEGQPGE